MRRRTRRTRSCRDMVVGKSGLLLEFLDGLLMSKLLASLIS